jgi:hypothetical protein
VEREHEGEVPSECMLPLQPSVLPSGQAEFFLDHPTDLGLDVFLLGRDGDNLAIGGMDKVRSAILIQKDDLPGFAEEATHEAALGDPYLVPSAVQRLFPAFGLDLGGDLLLWRGRIALGPAVGDQVKRVVLGDRDDIADLAYLPIDIFLSSLCFS